MKKYETIFILDPDLEEAQALSAIEKAKGIITQANGEILKVKIGEKENLPTKSKRSPKAIIS